MSGSPPRQGESFALRLTELDLQLRELESALRQQRQSEDRVRELQNELNQLLERGAKLIGSLERNGIPPDAMGEPERPQEEWQQTEKRLLEESARRIREFELRLEHEWEALRELHERPIKELKQRAVTLTETCLNAALVAQQAAARAEARLEALHDGVARPISDAARDMREAVALLRDRPDSSLPAGQTPDASDRPGADEWVARVGGSLVTDHAGRAERLSRNTTIALVAGCLILGAYAAYVHWSLATALRDAARVSAAAAQQAVEARQLAERQSRSAEQGAQRLTAEALSAAAKAERIVNVLAAPDLRRTDLLGQQGAPGAVGQVLWSRSRGLVLTASRLPRPPADRAYQVWLTTSRGPIGLGFVSPDAEGRANAAFEIPPELSGTVLGFTVTLEPVGGNTAPTGSVVLSGS